MKKINLLLMLTGVLFTFSKSFAQFQCGSDEAIRRLWAEDPQLKKDMEEMMKQAQLEAFGNQKDGLPDSNVIIYIPLVFHILHEYGPENISDAQVKDEVRILNIDYRKLNLDTSAIVPQFKPYAKDAHIQFRLASLDPLGNCTNGIEHIYTHLTNDGDDYVKLNQWPRNRYLNVWVINKMSAANGSAAGYAYYPSGVEGAGYFRDGVLILHNYIGSIGTSSPYTSRALTHEIGHVLSLPHCWGGTNNPGVACGDDGVPDTPVTMGHDNCSNKYDYTCSNPSFPANYIDFDTVSTTTGTTAIWSDTIFERTKLTPFKAVGLSANPTRDSAFAFSGWDIGATNGLTDSTLLTGSINTGKYYEVSFTSTLRYLSTITSINFEINRSATGPRTYAVRSSADGFNANLNASVTNADTNLNMIGTSNIFFYNKDTTIKQTTSKISLSGASFTDIDFMETVTFRIYAWNAEDAAGDFSIDRVTFVGKSGLVENVQNFMEYSYCSNMYTIDQVQQMRTALHSVTSDRNNLWTAQNLASTGTADSIPATCAPVADFQPDDKYVCEGDAVHFTDYSTNATVTSWSWTFENGTPSTSTSQNPTVSFAGNGWHEVTLTVSNGNGSDTKTTTQSVFCTTYNDIQGPYSESFDGTSAGWWLIDNPENDYTVFSLVDGVGVNNTKCMELKNYKDLSGVQPWDYDYYYTQRLGLSKDAIISPNFDLSNTTSASMTFRYAYATNATASADITEKLVVYSSTDCGKTWQTRKSMTGTELLTAGSGWTDYVPNDPVQWKTANVSVPTASTYKNVRFKFQFVASDFSNNLYLDDINILGTMGIPNNPLADATVSVYPNPVSKGSQLNVSYQANGNPMTIRLTDMTGRIVYEGVNTQTSGEVKTEISVSSTLAPGVYSFRITDGNYFLDKKVVVQ